MLSLYTYIRRVEVMKKRIYIVRHAKSSWTDFSLSDFERPLDERGLRDAPVMASFLKNKGIEPEVMISSPAERARTTAMIFSDAYNKEVTWIDHLYHGEPDDYLDQIQLLDENVTSVMLFGHNPGITYIAHLVKSGSTQNVPTCGVLEMSMKASTLWEEANWIKMSLDNINTPKSI